MTKISTFTYKDQDVEVLLTKGNLSYTFEAKGKRFGNAVKVKGRSNLELLNASFSLFLNFAETLDATKNIK